MAQLEKLFSYLNEDMFCGNKFKNETCHDFHSVSHRCTHGDVMMRERWGGVLKTEMNLYLELSTSWKGLKLFRFPRETAIRLHSLILAVSIAGEYSE